MIKINYIIDNDSWSDEEFNNQQDTDRIFVITREMIEELIYQNVEFEEGTDIADFYVENN